jgi:type III secretory pathway component EscR
MQVFLYVLIAASASIFFSLLFLIPVINKVKKNKQEVLELFTHRNIEKHIDEQLKACRNFIQMRLQQSNENVGGNEQDIDGQQD